MTTRTLVLPRLVAGRDFADDMVDTLGSFAETIVLIDASQLANGTSSFAAQLVERILTVGGAQALVLEGAPRRFQEYVQLAARDLKVTDKVDFTATVAVAAG